MFGSFAAASTSLNALRTLQSSSGEPIVDVNTRSEPVQLLPALSFSRFCWLSAEPEGVVDVFLPAIRG